MSYSMQTAHRDRQGAGRGLPLLGCAVLLLTAAMSLLWSQHKLLEQDEIFSLQTDRVASLAEVFGIQRQYPISLEPPPYHVLAHAAMQLFGPTAFALRLPALLGYLLMQLCLFFFVRNLTEDTTHNGFGARAGLVAMAIPALTWTMYYGAEGRPYGLLLGSYALAVLCWQLAASRSGHLHTDEARPLGEPLPNAALKGTGFSPYVEGQIKSGALAPERSSRILSLLGLTLALALTLNIHFYGVLLLVPLCGAELVRTLSRRRLDPGMLAAILIGTASLVLTVPYIKSAGEFKQHYYAGPVPWHMLTQPYRQMLVDYTAYPRTLQTAMIALMVVAAAAVLLCCIAAIRRDELHASPAEWTMVLLLTALPVFAFVLGSTVTHALEVRHSIGAILGITSLIAISLLPLLHRRSIFVPLMCALLVGILVLNGEHVRQSAAEAQKTIADLTLPPALQAELAATPDHNIYFQDLGEWEVASLYEPDAALRSHLVLVYSHDAEMRYEQHDTMYLTATHTQRFSSQPIVSFEQLEHTPGEHIFATYHSGWDWTSAAFRDTGAQQRPLGAAFGGELVGIRFRQ
jgi:hypothetical protein